MFQVANDVENVVFRRGPSSTIPSTKVPGTILIETDTGRVYVDDTESSRIQLKDDTKLPLEGTAKKSESDVNGNSLVGRITTVETDADTGVVTFKNEKGESKGTAVNSSYVDNATAQSDWNQNDETAVDFVKNRPFYTGGLVDAEIADISALASSAGTKWELTSDSEPKIFILQLSLDGLLDIKVGGTYKIIVDGNVYQYAAIDGTAAGDPSSIVLGDLEALLNNDMENFSNVFMYGPDRSIFIYIKSDVAPTSYKLYGQTQEIKKIDSKYLPTISINGKSFDTDGNLNLVPDDIGAVQPVIIEVSGDGTASMSSSDVLKLIKKGANPILIYLNYIYTCNSAYLRTNSSENIEFIRIDMVRIDIDRDNYYLRMRKATLSGTQVTFLNYDEDMKLPYSGYSKPYQYVSVSSSKGVLEYKDIEYKITLSRTDDGVWSCDKTMLEIEEALHYIKPYVYIEARNINALGYDIPLHGWFELPYIGVEASELESNAHTFSGVYDRYIITATIGPNNSSNITVRIEENGSTTVDSSLSDTSTNPVQNKVIKSYIDSITIDDGSID